MYKMIYSGFQGKLGTQNARVKVILHVVQIVAPVAH